MINKYPYTDFNEYNLDWVITHMKDLIREWASTKTEWSDMQTEFADLKNYIDTFFENLDLQEEVNNKLDEMAADGTLENLLLPYLASIVTPSRTLQLLRYGRFLDEFSANSRQQVLGGQCCAYYGGYFFEGGSFSGNTRQSISVWDDTGNLIRFKNDYTSLYHVNSLAVDANYIYVVCQDSDNTIAIINKGDLSIADLVTFPALNVVYAITNYNDDIYFLNYSTIDGVDYILVNKYDKVLQTAETVNRLLAPINRVPQNFCIYQDKLYLLFGQSNMIYRYNFNDSDIEYMYYIPSGDNVWPCGECEGLIVKDDNIMIYSMAYEADTVITDYFTAFTQIFKTDITGPLQKNLAYDYMPNVTDLMLMATSGAYDFNPQLTVTTAEEISVLANYHKNATLIVNDISSGKLYLKDGHFMIVGLSGSRTLDVFEAHNCVIEFNTFATVNKIHLKYCKATCSGFNIGTSLTIIRSTVEFNQFYMSGTVFDMEKSHVTINDIRSIDTAIGFSTTSQAGNVLNINSKYKSGIVKLCQGAIGSSSSSDMAYYITAVLNNNISFTDSLTRAALINANNGTAANHSLYNSYWTAVKHVNGNIYVTESGNEIEMPANTMVQITVLR